MESIVCAIDIGNTNTTAGLVDCATLTCRETETVSSRNCVEHLPAIVEKLARQYDFSCRFPIKICTVIRSLQEEVIKKLSPLSCTASVSVISVTPNLPVTVVYDNPESLGTDRIANCFYCQFKYPDTNCIIIDAGTAVTIDMFSADAVFEGGFIVPGYTLQLNALHTDTAELPQITPYVDNEAFPPHTTQSCIAQGVRISLAGGIERIIGEIRSKRPHYSTIVTCGGGWRTLQNLVSFSYDYQPEMTLIGTGLYRDI